MISSNHGHVTVHRLPENPKTMQQHNTFALLSENQLLMWAVIMQHRQLLLHPLRDATASRETTLCCNVALQNHGRRT